LLELLIAVVFVSVAVTAISLLFPKASASITNNRYRFLASNFAAARIQELKEQPYALIQLTPYNAAYFTSNATTAGGCDCKAVLNWAALPNAQGAPGPDATYIEDGVTYTRQVCIDLISLSAGNWNSYCPDTANNFVNDTGLKSIKVHVSWTYGSNSYSYDTESQVAR